MTVTMAEAVARYLRERKERGEVRPSSLRTIRHTLNTVLNTVGWDLPASRLRRSHIEKWLGRKELSPASRRSQLSIVRMFCRWMVDQGISPKDATAAIRAPRQPRYMPRGLKLAEVQAILAACPDARSELVILLMVQLGLRACEVVGIEMGDIDRDERLVLIRNGKGGHQRVLPIPIETWEVMERYRRQHRSLTAGPLIRGEYSRRPMSAKYMSRLVSQVIHDAGVDASGHALRHSCASDLLRRGVHLRDVQRVLGHESIATTERYLPWVVGDLRDAMEGRTYRPDRRPKRREAAGGDAPDDAA